MYSSSKTTRAPKPKTSSFSRRVPQKVQKRTVSCSVDHKPLTSALNKQVDPTGYIMPGHNQEVSSFSSKLHLKIFPFSPISSTPIYTTSISTSEKQKQCKQSKQRSLDSIPQYFIPISRSVTLHNATISAPHQTQFHTLQILPSNYPPCASQIQLQPQLPTLTETQRSRSTIVQGTTLPSLSSHSHTPFSFSQLTNRSLFPLTLTRPSSSQKHSYKSTTGFIRSLQAFALKSSFTHYLRHLNIIFPSDFHHQLHQSALNFLTKLTAALVHSNINLTSQTDLSIAHFFLTSVNLSRKSPKLTKKLRHTTKHVHSTSKRHFVETLKNAYASNFQSKQEAARLAQADNIPLGDRLPRFRTELGDGTKPRTYAGERVEQNLGANEAAQFRQGPIFLNSTGLTRSNLRSYGVTMFQMNTHEMESRLDEQKRRELREGSYLGWDPALLASINSDGSHRAPPQQAQQTNNSYYSTSQHYTVPHVHEQQTQHRQYAQDTPHSFSPPKIQLTQTEIQGSPPHWNRLNFSSYNDPTPRTQHQFPPQQEQNIPNLHQTVNQGTYSYNAPQQSQNSSPPSSLRQSYSLHSSQSSQPPPEQFSVQQHNTTTAHRRKDHMKMMEQSSNASVFFNNNAIPQPKTPRYQQYYGTDPYNVPAVQQKEAFIRNGKDLYVPSGSPETAPQFHKNVHHFDGLPLQQ